MTEKEEFDKFILYGIEGNILTRECIKNEILLLFITILLLWVKHNNIIFFFFGLLPSVIYFIAILRLSKCGKIERENYLLHNGIMSLCLSYLFGMIGIAISLYLVQGKELIVLLCFVCILYGLATMLYYNLIKRAIDKRAYSNAKKTSGGLWMTAFAVLGIAFARVFLTRLDNISAGGVICFSCFMLSILSELGIVNIFKYRYIVKHKEVLVEDKKRAR